MNDTCWGWGQGCRREKTKGLRRATWFVVRMNLEALSQLSIQCQMSLLRPPPRKPAPTLLKGKGFAGGEMQPGPVLFRVGVGSAWGIKCETPGGGAAC